MLLLSHPGTVKMVQFGILGKVENSSISSALGTFHAETLLGTAGAPEQTLHVLTFCNASRVPSVSISAHLWLFREAKGLQEVRREDTVPCAGRYLCTHAVLTLHNP